MRTLFIILAIFATVAITGCGKKTHYNNTHTTTVEEADPAPVAPDKWARDIKVKEDGKVVGVLWVGNNPKQMPQFIAKFINKTKFCLSFIIRVTYIDVEHNVHTKDVEVLVNPGKKFLLAEHKCNVQDIGCKFEFLTDIARVHND